MTSQADMNKLLLDAAKDGDTEAVERFLEAGADIDSRDTWARTPLILAIQGGYVALAQKIIEAGADIDLQDKGGQSALMWACESNPLASVALDLIARGADLDLIDDVCGWTALMKTAYYGHSALARRLIEAGADTEILNEDDTTAHGEAEYKNHHDIAAMLENAQEIRADYLANEGRRQQEARDMSALQASHAVATGHLQRLRVHAPRIRALKGVPCPK